MVASTRERSIASAKSSLQSACPRAHLADGPIAGAEDNAAGGHADWLAVFRKDIQDVLQAELDFRFQPVDGLLEALRAGHKG